jgi:hypothetical protein
VKSIKRYIIPNSPGNIIDFRDFEELSVYRFELILISTIFIFSLMAAGIYFFYDPASTQINKRASELLIDDYLQQIKPEPKEKLLYISALVLIPVLLWILILITEGFKFKGWHKKGIETGMAILLLGIGSSIFFKGHHSLTTKHLSDICSNFVIFPGVIWYILVLVFLVLLYYFSNFKILKRISLIAALSIFIILPIFITFISNIFYFPTGLAHFNAVFYSSSQVYHGKFMLNDGFTNTYGLYPHFLNPLFQVIRLNVLNFSMVMSFLNVLCFGAIFWFLYREMTDKFMAIITTGSIISFYMHWVMVANDPYFQFFPIRTIFPCLLLILASFYKAKKTLSFFVLGTFFMALDLLWNPDMGIFTYISWIAFVIYSHTFDERKIYGKVNLILRISIFSISIVVLIIFIYILIIYFAYGQTPKIFSLFSTIYVFSGLGFLMLPMGFPHPWLIPAMLLIISFGVSLYSYHKNLSRHSVIFLVSCICIGFFSYYQGRSHIRVFTLILPFFLILLGLLTDQLHFRTGYLILKASKIIGMIILMSGIPALLKMDRKIFYTTECLYKKEIMPAAVLSNIEFIRRCTYPNEKILVFDPFIQGIYLNASNTISAFDPALNEMFFKNDQQRFQKLIETTNLKIFMDLNVSQVHYRRIFTNGNMGMFYYRKNE